MNITNIECVSTPQFKNGVVDHYLRQFGSFDRTTFLFIGSDKNGHSIHFTSIEDFEKFQDSEWKSIKRNIKIDELLGNRVELKEEEVMEWINGIRDKKKLYEINY